MWSDRPDAAALRGLVERLRAILPEPRAGARAVSEALDWRRDAAEVAAGLWHAHGFSWLDQPRARLFANPLATLEVSDRKATVHGPGGTVRVEAGGFDLLEAALAAWGGPADGLLCGYLGYELGMELEDVPRPSRRSGDLPDLYLALYDWRLEHEGGAWRFHGTDAWRTIRAGDVEAQLRRRVSEDEEVEGGPVSSSPGADGFRDAVGRGVERIHRGELFQVNLCRRLESTLDASGIWPLYERWRAINPASHGALLRVDASKAVLSVSPESFLSAESGHVRSCPIKGTRPRGRSAEEDRALAKELQECEKDRAELAMIVDVTRNDLGRVCRAGSVVVTKHAELMTIPTLHHTYSEVSGVLREECGPAELLRASFPPASITGAPKIHAMQVAAEEEGWRRGPAMGAIGWISMAGDLDLSVAIRTAAASNGRIAYLAGCGITADSAPQAELEESEAKAAAFERALRGDGARVNAADDKKRSSARQALP
jgi:para-aminobenzoate synthetase component 1